IDNFTFVPATITVPKGGTVVWSNRDDMVHSVVASDASFKSAPLDTDDRYSHTFTEAGEVTYFCGLHPQMIGHIVVKP
ncbi:MAG TPA: plastocyanin/azurin family copper-binding protein, partial [Magnetospirillum sp.]|nr:plastocyanin/azurin family copper-binding protein [Magnetospirillum sp.]